MRNVIARSRKATWQSLAAFLLPLTLTLAACGDDDSSSASSNDDPGVESSSSEAVFSSSSSEQFFVPSEYRTCDKKYEGKFLLYQYRETLDALYGTYRVNTVFYKCKNGKWSGPSATSPENLTEGDVIRAAPDDWEGDEFHFAPDDWECDAENEGQVQSWRFMVFAVPHSPMGYTPTYYARCEQGDWVLCEPESSSSNSSSSVIPQSSDSETSVSSSSLAESSSSVAESSSSEVTSESSSSATSVSSSSADVQSSSSEVTIDFRDESVYDSSSNTLTDFRDGQTYRTVKIKFVNSNYELDSMVWMTENLNYAYVDVPYDYDIFKVSENHSDSSSWCYDNDAANCAKYGRLYTWAAAMDSVGEWSSSGKECGYTSACSPTYPVRGICPKGWHLPDSTEWNTLIAAGALSFVNLRTNSGYRDYKEEYYHEGQLAYFWSSSEYVSTEYTYNSQEARNFVISENNGESETFSRGVLGGFYKYVGNSVRCVKD